MEAEDDQLIAMTRVFLFSKAVYVNCKASLQWALYGSPTLI